MEEPVATVVERARKGAAKGGLQKVRVTTKGRRITPEQKAIFFAQLMDSCNVQASARAAGIGGTHIYWMRRRDPAFRKEWDRAAREGYACLQMDALRRARFGMEETTTVRGEVMKVIHRYSDRLTIYLLGVHRALAGAPGDDETDGEDSRSLIRRLRMTLERMAPAGNRAPDETANGAANGNGDA